VRMSGKGKPPMTSIVPVAQPRQLPSPAQQPAPRRFPDVRPAASPARPRSPDTVVTTPAFDDAPRFRGMPAATAGTTWSGQKALGRYREIAALPDADQGEWLGRFDARV